MVAGGAIAAHRRPYIANRTMHIAPTAKASVAATVSAWVQSCRFITIGVGVGLPSRIDLNQVIPAGEAPETVAIR
jgi:hypothetical protein